MPEFSPSLMLDDAWDLTLDGAGDIAVADAPPAYAIAQNVACAVRLFTDDAYYDPEKGIPHFQIDLGRPPDESVLRTRIRKAALAVTGVADVQVASLAIGENRELIGDIVITTTAGEVAYVDI